MTFVEEDQFMHSEKCLQNAASSKLAFLRQSMKHEIGSQGQGRDPRDFSRNKSAFELSEHSVSVAVDGLHEILHSSIEHW